MSGERTSIMPTIKQQVAANQTRIAAGGETGTGVGPQDVAATTMAPSQDLPAGGGLPQRGMFPANLTLNSDRSDSNRAFRGDGMRSSTFPFAPPTISNTIVEKAQSSTSNSGSSVLSGLAPGPGISITASGKGFTVSGTTGTLQMPNIFSVGGALPVTAFPDGGPMVVGLVGEPTGTFFAAPALSSHPPSLDVVTQASGTAANATATATPSSSPDFAMYFITAAASGSYQNGTISAGWTTVFITTPARIGVYSQSGITGPTSVTDTDSFTQWASVLALFATQNSTPTVVQNTSAGFVTGSGSATFGSSLTAGNTVIAAFGGNYASITSVSDSEGNTYRLVGTSSETVGGTTLTVTVYAASNVLGGTAATVNFTASSVSNADIWIGELSNFGTVLGQPSFRIIVNTDLDGAIFGASGTNHNAGAVPDPGGTAGSTRFLNEDATWLIPPVFIASGANHAVGYVPDPGATPGTTRFLREDATWVVPPQSLNGAETKSINYTAVAGDTGKLIAFNTSAQWVLVQSADASTTHVAYSSSVTKNNLLLMIFGVDNTFTPSVSDTLGNTWTQIGTVQNRGDGYFMGLFYAVAGSSGSNTVTITGTGTGGSFPGITVLEFSGNAVLGVLDQDSQTSGSSLTMANTVNATDIGELVLGAFVGTNAPYTAGPGFTLVNNSNAGGQLEYATSSASGTQTIHMNQNSSGDWGAISATFLSGPGSNLTLTLPAASPSSDWVILVENIGPGTLTINPNSLLLDGLSGSIVLSQNQGVYITTDGTNYFTERGLLPSPIVLVDSGGIYSDRISLAAQTASISATNLVVSPTATSLYKISYYLNETTAGTSGTVTVTFSWNDGASQSVTSATVTFGTLGAYASGVIVVKATSGAIQYSTTVTSPVGSPAYSLDIRVLPLG